MGFGSFFKRMFTKQALALPEKSKGAFIHPLTTGLLTVNLGEKIVVEDGWAAIVVVKDKAQDLFYAGTHEMSLSFLPNTTRALKLNKGKVKKKGNTADVIMPSKFKCDLYYINLAPFSNQLWNTGKVSVKDKNFGSFKYSMTGNFDFKTTDPMSTVNLFLIDWGHILPGKALEKLAFLVSDACTAALVKSKFTNPNELNNHSQISEYLLAILNKSFQKYGLIFSNLKVTQTVFPKEINARLEQVGRNLQDNGQLTLGAVLPTESETAPQEENEFVLVGKSAEAENAAMQPSQAASAPTTQEKRMRKNLSKEIKTKKAEEKVENEPEIDPKAARELPADAPVFRSPKQEDEEFREFTDYAHDIQEEFDITPKEDPRQIHIKGIKFCSKCGFVTYSDEINCPNCNTKLDS